jgi:hypothetical protein
MQGTNHSKVKRLSSEKTCTIQLGNLYPTQHRAAKKKQYITYRGGLHTLGVISSFDIRLHHTPYTSRIHHRNEKGHQHRKPP